MILFLDFPEYYVNLTEFMFNKNILLLTILTEYLTLKCDIKIKFIFS
jgi:hypothetical protein